MSSEGQTMWIAVLFLNIFLCVYFVFVIGWLRKLGNTKKGVGEIDGRCDRDELPRPIKTTLQRSGQQPTPFVFRFSLFHLL